MARAFVRSLRIIVLSSLFAVGLNAPVAFADTYGSIPNYGLGTFSAAIDGKGDLWVGQGNGTYEVAPGGDVTRFPNFIGDVSESANGSILLIDSDGGLYEYSFENNSFELVVPNVGMGFAWSEAVQLANGDIYVSNCALGGVGSICKVEDSTAQVIAQVSGDLRSAALAENGDPLFASVEGTVFELDPRTNEVISLVTGLDYPQGLAVDGAGNIWVSETVSQSISEWSANGGFIGRFSGNSNPNGIAISASGTVYVADWWGGVSSLGTIAVPPRPEAPVFNQSPQAVAPNSVQWSWSDLNPSITSFSWRGACSGTGDVTTVTCSGLTGGNAATLTVIAMDGSGSSDPVSSTAVAEGVPGSPQLGIGSVVGIHQAQWSWSDDAANGAPITSYTWSGACSGSGDVTTVTCSNLPGGSTESLSVVATNAMGDSPASSASIAMPITAPDGVAVSVVSGPMGFRASWSAPANGGSPLTGYNVQVLSASGQVVTQQTLPASATSFGATKLTNGANYSFAITATNAALLASTPVVTSNIVPLAEVKLTESAATYSYGAAKSLLTVKVAPTATGTVTFSSGSTVLCTANVSKGSASCSVSATSLNAGTYSITANFSGNATTAPSETSSSLVVSKAKSTLSLVLNKTKLPRSQVASIVASAVLSSPIGSTPPGLVTFTLDGKAIANNSSSLSFSSLAGLNLSAGTHVIEVTYGGSTNYLGSTAKATFTLS